MTTLLCQLGLLTITVGIAYAVAPKPWALPELRVLEHEDGAHFRAQYKVRALWHHYWVDVEHLQSAGKRIPWVYPSRTMAEACIKEVLRKHELRDPRRWR